LSSGLNTVGSSRTRHTGLAMSSGTRAQLEGYLRDHRVKANLIEHARSESAAAEARAAHLPAEQTAKTLVLHTPGGYRFAVIPGSDRLDLNKVAAALDVSRHQLRLATESDMATDFPGYEVGAIPPLGPDTPAELIDMRLLAYQQVLCPAGDHEHSFLLDPADIVRVTAAQTLDLRED
jgi:prolyl-tRNA editing enzyme YbaK/EbsC (Cys-tRNA(Pro) deacylase)